MTCTGVEEEAWGYLIVCVPIVVIFAPLGSIISSHFHRFWYNQAIIFNNQPLIFCNKSIIFYNKFMEEVIHRYSICE